MAPNLDALKGSVSAMNGRPFGKAVFIYSTMNIVNTIISALKLRRVTMSFLRSREREDSMPGAS